MYMFVYTLYKSSMSVYWFILFYESVRLCLPVFVRGNCVVVYSCLNKCCIVHMFGWAPGKISIILTGPPSLNKVF